MNDENERYVIEIEFDANAKVRNVVKVAGALKYLIPKSSVTICVVSTPSKQDKLRDMEVNK